MAKIIDSRRLSMEEIRLVNNHMKKIGHQYDLFGGSICTYDDGKRVATFASSASYVSDATARTIGELMLSVLEIDKVEHNGYTVASK